MLATYTCRKGMLLCADAASVARASRLGLAASRCWALMGKMRSICTRRARNRDPPISIPSSSITMTQWRKARINFGAGKGVQGLSPGLGGGARGEFRGRAVPPDSKELVKFFHMGKFKLFQIFRNFMYFYEDFITSLRITSEKSNKKVTNVRYTCQRIFRVWAKKAILKSLANFYLKIY